MARVTALLAALIAGFVLGAGAAPAAAFNGPLPPIDLIDNVGGAPPGCGQGLTVNDVIYYSRCSDQSIYRTDPETGETSSISTPGFFWGGLAYNPNSHTVYGSDQFCHSLPDGGPGIGIYTIPTDQPTATPTHVLDIPASTINPATGAPLLNPSAPGGCEPDLSYDATENLLKVAERGVVIYDISDPNDITMVGGINPNPAGAPIDGFTFDPQNMYVASGPNVFSIDKSTSQVNASDSIAGSFGSGSCGFHTVNDEQRRGVWFMGNTTRSDSSTPDREAYFWETETPCVDEVANKVLELGCIAAAAISPFGNFVVANDPYVHCAPQTASQANLANGVIKGAESKTDQNPKPGQFSGQTQVKVNASSHVARFEQTFAGVKIVATGLGAEVEILCKLDTRVRVNERKATIGSLKVGPTTVDVRRRQEVKVGGLTVGFGVDFVDRVGKNKLNVQEHTATALVILLPNGESVQIATARALCQDSLDRIEEPAA